MWCPGGQPGEREPATDLQVEGTPGDLRVAFAYQREVPLARLLSERSLSVNTAAAGGNASLMTLQA